MPRPAPLCWILCTHDGREYWSGRSPPLAPVREITFFRLPHWHSRAEAQTVAAALWRASKIYVTPCSVRLL